MRKIVRKWTHRTELRTLQSGHVVDGPTARMAVLREIRDNVIPGGRRAGAHRLALSMEEFAKKNASWSDRTGDARNGLVGYVDEAGGAITAVIAHAPGLDYPFWLEVRWGGRFAILGPTQEAHMRFADRLIMDEVELELRGRGSKFRHRESGQFAA